ncbi:unnamed protein product [Linum tenue]|uniref:Fungal lipase-type domain-containing protein n=1 Tax=Linum tenue TaxID=586396 RepID=A0AAV0QN21_9ROSI|nr:unnamed protein product [Linum tenue]
MTPTFSPKRDISARWHDLHGAGDWAGLLDPLDPALRAEILKYGEFASATYDAFDFDPLSEFCGSCRYNRHKMLHELGLAAKHGYTTATRYIYAMSHVDVPNWLARTSTTWSRDSNWMGKLSITRRWNWIYRHVGMKLELHVSSSPYLKKEFEIAGSHNLEVYLHLVDGYVSEGAKFRWNARRDYTASDFIDWGDHMTPTLSPKRDISGRWRELHGIDDWDGLLDPIDPTLRCEILNASEQVTEELLRLVRSYREKGEAEISITVTGHSLGGALSLLTAYEAASLIPDVYISVISFGAPRVGNLAFREKMKELGVKVLRVEVEEDIVRNLPGIVMNTVLKKLSITKRLNWIYRHVGKQLKLHVSSSPYLKKESDMVGSHNLEVYLHLVDGFVSRGAKYRWNARRDLALVNKNSDMLIPELKIPQFWYHMPYKGLVRNRYGRWVKPGREPEDIPSPFSSELSCREPILELVEC